MRTKVGGVQSDLLSVCLHKIAHRFIGQPRNSELAALRDWSKQRAIGDLCRRKPRLDGIHRACRTASYYRNRLPVAFLVGF